MASFVNMREAPELEWRGFFSSIEHLHASSHVAYCFFFFFFFQKDGRGASGRFSPLPPALSASERFSLRDLLFLFFSFSLEKTIGAPQRGFHSYCLPWAPQRGFRPRIFLFHIFFSRDSWGASMRFSPSLSALGASERFSRKDLFISIFISFFFL